MTKEQDFKNRFAIVLRDLQADGAKDPEAVSLLGSLADDLSKDLNASDWTKAKQSMTSSTYDVLLQKLQDEGNAHRKAGRVKHAYVIQVLAMSLVAHTQRADPDMKVGDGLLDAAINRAILLHRNRPEGV